MFRVCGCGKAVGVGCSNALQQVLITESQVRGTHTPGVSMNLHQLRLVRVPRQLHSVLFNSFASADQLWLRN